MEIMVLTVKQSFLRSVEKEEEREGGERETKGYSNALSKPVTPQTIERVHNLDAPTVIKKYHRGYKKSLHPKLH